MEAVPALDALEDEEIRGAGGELNVGRPDHRSAIEMRSDLGVMRLRHRRDLLGFEQSADPAEVRLQDRGRAGLEHAGELVFRRQPLASGDRHAAKRGDPRHLLRRLGRRRLLEPQRLVGLDPAGETQRAGDGELAVGAEQEVAFLADRLAQSLAEGLAEREPLEARLAGVEGGIGAGGVELHRGEPLRDILQRPLGRSVRVRVDRAVGIGVRAGLVRVEIGVAAQPLVDFSAEKLVDRLVDRLADDVPQRHLEAGEHAHQRDVGPQRIAAPVDVAPQGLDAERVHAGDMALEHVLDHWNEGGGREARRIDLADTLDPAGGLEFQEHEIAAAERGRRIADDEGLELSDLHLSPPLPSPRSSPASGRERKVKTRSRF